VRIVQKTGDGLLVEFPSVVEAVACAVAVQRGMAERNGDPDEQQIVFRVGIIWATSSLRRTIDIHGDGVNVAARLEALGRTRWGLHIRHGSRPYRRTGWIWRSRIWVTRPQEYRSPRKDLPSSRSQHRNRRFID